MYTDAKLEPPELLEENEQIVVFEKKQSFDDEACRMLVDAKNYVITNNETYERSQKLILAVKAFIRTIEDDINPHIKRANDTHKALTKHRNKLLDPLNEAWRSYKGKGERYHAELMRQAQVEQVRLAKIQRIAEEEAQKIEEEKRIEQAQAAEQRGEKELAESIINAPPKMMTAPPPLPISKVMVPKIKGVRYTPVYKAELIDPEKVPTRMLMGNAVRKALEAAANKMLIATDGQAPLPGFKVTKFMRQSNSSS